MKPKKVEDLVPTDIVYITIAGISKLGIVLLKQQDNRSTIGWWYLTCLVDCSIKIFNSYGLQKIMTARIIK